MDRTKGDWNQMLIWGGSSSVGQYAIQIAEHFKFGYASPIEQLGVLVFTHHDAIRRTTCPSDAATVVSFTAANVARPKHVGRPSMATSTSSE
jgi:hypothetical protein